MYLYETHLHTSPVSKCARATPEETVQFYKALGYDGIFVTNHFLDGNCAADRSLSHTEQIRWYFSDYDRARAEGDKVGLKVFPGVEMTYGGTDFLVYGLSVEWYEAHPEILHMDKRFEMEYLMKTGALVVQAHPFREAGYIDHIRLYPRSVEGIEVNNANRTETENAMALAYAKAYGLLMTAGSDNHSAAGQKHLAGMMSAEPLFSDWDYIRTVRAGKMERFTKDL